MAEQSIDLNAYIQIQLLVLNGQVGKNSPGIFRKLNMKMMNL